MRFWRFWPVFRAFLANFVCFVTVFLGFILEAHRDVMVRPPPPPLVTPSSRSVRPPPPSWPNVFYGWPIRAFLFLEMYLLMSPIHEIAWLAKNPVCVWGVLPLKVQKNAKSLKKCEKLLFFHNYCKRVFFREELIFAIFAIFFQSRK